MPDLPPFMNSVGLVSKILTKVKEAETPPMFSHDFLANTLGYGSGSARPFVALMKRLGFVGTDGTPTDLYKRFKNAPISGGAMAEALRKAYKAFYAVNENLHTLDRPALAGVAMQVTGREKDDATLTAICGTFLALKEFATFDHGPKLSLAARNGEQPPASDPLPPANLIPPQAEMGMNLSYTINLNLPETTNVQVFNAIFQSLREHLLGR